MLSVKVSATGERQSKALLSLITTHFWAFTVQLTPSGLSKLSLQGAALFRTQTTKKERVAGTVL